MSIEESRIYALEANVKMMSQSLEHISKSIDAMNISMTEITKYNSEVLLIKKELEHMNREIKESFDKDRDTNKKELDRIWLEIRGQKSIINKIIWIIITPVIIAIIGGVIKSS